MKKVVTLFFIDLILILLQKSFFPVFFDYRYYIDLYLAFTMALFLEEKETEAFVSALVGGLLADVLGMGLVGVSSFVVTSLLLVLRFTKRFFYRNWPLRVAFALLVFYIYVAITNVENRWNVRHILISCLMTLAFTFFFRFLISRIFNEKRFS
ncbi:MAG: hypothetical protein WC243_02295 [Patescibacteria group bacterium]|jgi:cell shape-determining protein MreD